MTRRTPGMSASHEWEVNAMARSRTSFAGFPPEAFRFYELLGANNTKAFWTEHKADYDAYVRAPVDELATIVRDEFGPLHVFRPNRDVRFSSDKSPYKNHCGAVTEGEGGEAYYVQISEAGLMVASGYYHFAPDQLQRYRDALDSKAGPALERVLTACRAEGYEVGGAALKTAPRGYAKDHPLVHLLRHKGLHVSKSFGTPKWVHTPKALDRIVTTWRAAAPLHRWLNDHVGPSTMAPEEG
jgi:uncharacterized protein (TIGR02453 family)